MKKIITMIAIMVIAGTKVGFAQTKTEVALNQVLAAYYDVKNALATDKKDVAIEKAKVLSAKAEAVPHKDLSGEQHTIWMEQLAVIKAKTAELINSKDIKAERKAFEGISTAMTKTVKVIKFNNNTAYLQYCPMAKASWLNEKKDIENPYYGKMMFDCGSVKEEIKAN